jgi:DNA-binding NarL/FixJ family response regulator
MQPALARARELQGSLSAPNRSQHPMGLSERQLEVLRLAAAGRSNQEIADALVLSVRTVERHIADCYAKIGARNRSEATAFALTHLMPGEP